MMGGATSGLLRGVCSWTGRLEDGHIPRAGVQRILWCAIVSLPGDPRGEVVTRSWAVVCAVRLVSDTEGELWHLPLVDGRSTAKAAWKHHIGTWPGEVCCDGATRFGGCVVAGIHDVFWLLVPLISARDLIKGKLD